jgi:hypothetical protein
VINSKNINVDKTSITKTVVKIEFVKNKTIIQYIKLKIVMIKSYISFEDI